jgi:hypothetical protein
MSIDPSNCRYIRGKVVGFNFASEDGPRVKILIESEKEIDEVSVCAICDWNENEERKIERYVVRTKQQPTILITGK